MSQTKTDRNNAFEENTQQWAVFDPQYSDGDGRRASLGLIGLATDRVGILDFEDFVDGIDGVATFSTRLPMSPVVTSETLIEMGEHLEEATRLLVPGTRLDTVGFSCTTGTVAIGLEKVHATIRRVRPESQITTPIEAAAKGLQMLGCRRISLLAPYLLETAPLISGFFEASGFEVVRRATFNLDGDPEMNRVSTQALIEAGIRIFDPTSDGLFISCTGLRTAPVVAALEAALGKPVVTSNQSLAWDSLRLAGVHDQVEGRGRLFSLL